MAVTRASQGSLAGVGASGQGPAGGVLAFGRTGTLALVAGSSRLYNPRSDTLSLTSARASVNTAPVGADAVIEVLKNGSTTVVELTVIDGEYTSGRIALTNQSLVDGDYLVVNITQVGSTTAGSDLVVQLEFA